MTSIFFNVVEGRGRVYSIFEVLRIPVLESTKFHTEPLHLFTCALIVDDVRPVVTLLAEDVGVWERCTEEGLGSVGP